MPKLVVIILSSLIICSGQAQDFSKLLPEDPPKNSKENIKYMVAGFTLQVVGLGLASTSVYLTIIAAEENIELGFSGLGMGLGIAVAGTALVANSFKNIALEKKAWREFKKEQRKNKVTFNIQPTMYGVGIVCRF